MAFIAASLLIVLRMYVYSNACHDYSPKMALIKATSIAIWNKNKLVTAIALGVWVTNIAFLIRGNWTCPFRLTYMINLEFNLRP